ncbi:BnaCnng02740D [Brassica napus]|uniref:BnaCnng02740D protein n=1 Tax=Brassica napus TaxID=3708 RepID=A0A078FE39_BRANA|nr:BnaCnng02740D [Brassica napus]
MKKNPLTQSEDLTIKGFERFRFSLMDGQKHKSTHTKGKKKKEEISCRF